VKTIVTLIVGLIVGYGLAYALPPAQLAAKLANVEMPDMSGGHELNTEAGVEKPKQ